MSNPNLQGFLEVVNASLYPVFTNTTDNDIAIYTTATSQSIHFGTKTDNSAPSALKVTNSNVEINGDIALTKRVRLNGLCINPRASAGDMQNITASVSTTSSDNPNLLSLSNQVSLVLTGAQSDFRFLNSSEGVVMNVSGAGVLTASNIVASNLTVGGTAVALSNHTHDLTTASITGVLPVTKGGTGVGTSTGSGSVVLSAGPTFTGTVSAATINATTLQQGGVGVSVVGHTHAATDITSGVLAVARGGTGVGTSTGSGNVVLSVSPTLTGTVAADTINATTLQQGGVGVALTGHTHAAADVTSGVFGVARGGTGQSNLIANKLIVGNGTTAVSSPSNLHWDSVNNRLGINQVAPSQALDVTGNIYCTGDVTVFSDARIKKDIVKIEGALAKLQQINGYTFARSDLDDGKRYAGVIAQEVQRVMPEVVNVRDGDGMLSVAYGNMIALLIEAVKELKLQQ